MIFLASQVFAPDISPTIVGAAKLIFIAAAGLLAIVLIDKYWPEEKRRR